MIDVPQLLRALDITAKKAGNRYWAICPSPDHDDHAPSWFMWDLPGDRTRHGKHRCYGCGFRGGATHLVRSRLGLDWDEAGRALERMEISYTPLNVQLEIREATRPVVKPPDWVRFAERFEDWPDLAREYLTGTKRRMTWDVVRRWGLGYIAKGDKALAHRIWIPIRNSAGLLVTWQARTYVDDPLRYMTPERFPATVLYGCEHWPEVEDRSVVVAVEGPFDALSVDRATRLPTAAVIGSNPSPLQLQSLTTFRTVVVMSDADAAGDKLATTIQGLGRWTKVERVRLAEGADPGGATDEVLRSALSAWL